jgi:ActR/RegA family two-component response regulator
MMPVAEAVKSIRTAPPRLLVVDDEAPFIEFVGDALERSLNCKLSTASSVAQAQKILQSEPIDLLIVDLNLPDGSGTQLLKTLHEHSPLAGAIVITGAPTVDTAVAALRQGAVDFLAKPFSLDDFLHRLRSALHRQWLQVKNEHRIDRLRDAVRRLNEARKVVAKKVDLLCNDLISAYGDLSRQLDLVRISESFRGAIHSADDLEQMLCHAMDWLLRQLGYANVAIWLASEPGFQLGAYMKYTVPGEPPLIEAMRTGILPMVVRDGVSHLSSKQVDEKLAAADAKFFKDQTILAAHCTYLGESLAQIVLFREGNRPFTAADIATLRTIGPVFAVTLATMVRQAPGEEGSDEPSENPFNDSGPLMDEEDDTPKKPRRPKKDDADWWKRGEDPPF